jgi:hypothetical protein
MFYFQSGQLGHSTNTIILKLEYDILRRNASTNVRKTYLIEKYILHWKPKHTIYVRYFSILLYLLNVQVAPTENKTSLTLWWRISLNVLSWQDSETRPGEFVIFMLSIIIELEDFEVNRLYKTRSWQMGFISRHRWGKKIIFIKKTDPAFYTPFLHKSYAWVFGVICTFQSSQFFERLSMHFGVVDHIRASALTTARGL